MAAPLAALPLDAPLKGIETVGAASNPLLEASPGLMIWTIVLFLLTLFILRRYVFGPLAAALEKRRTQIQQSIEEAESTRDEAVKLLEQYQAQLAEARREADQLRERARREGESQRAEIVGAAEAQRERVLKDTEEQVEAQSRQAMSGLRDDVVGLALAAAEKVTGKTLTEDDHRRLIEDAIRDADLSGLAGQKA
jgi:F-type H+-transporting ATPase subunit b